MYLKRKENKVPHMAFFLRLSATAILPTKETYYNLS